MRSPPDRMLQVDLDVAKEWDGLSPEEQAAFVKEGEQAAFVKQAAFIKEHK
jgi:hypothetical protein|eukprot:COSAG01_NODE_18620_length_1064_cov_0.795855_2_plen_51_part_00